MMDARRTQSAYRALPRLETARPFAFLAGALDALFAPCLCLLLATCAFAGTYCWLLHR